MCVLSALAASAFDSEGFIAVDMVVTEKLEHDVNETTERLRSSS